MANEKDLLLAALSSIGEKSGKPLKPEEMIEGLQKLGYKVMKEDPLREQGVRPIKTAAIERWGGGKRLRFGVVSDTQFCSRQQQITFLNQCYDRFVADGIDTVLHAGDLVDGDGRVYPGQEFDLFAHGYDAQLKYAIENYPVRPGLKTYLIAGNHDWSFWQRKGADILRALAVARPDIQYLGSKSAVVSLEGIKVQLMHPHTRSGVPAYARTYRLQKIIEQFAPALKPDILFAGDKHSWAHLPMYRNVYGWQCGCFQSQTNYEKELGLYPEIGALIVEIHYGTKGSDVRDQEKEGHEGRQSIVGIKHEILPMYVPIPNDY